MLTLLLPTVVAIVSWFAGSWLSAKRDLANKRRDLRLQYLVEAYRRFSNAAQHPMIPPYSSDMESAVADIQLFGSSAQVDLLHKFASEMSQKGQVSGTGQELLSNLRDDLRSELRLSPVEERILLYRPLRPSGSADDRSIRPT